MLVAVLPCWWNLLTAGLAVSPVACALCFCSRGLRVAELPGCVVEDVKQGAVIQEDVPAEHNGQTDYVSAAGKIQQLTQSGRQKLGIVHFVTTSIPLCLSAAGLPDMRDAASPAEPAENNDCCVISFDPRCEQQGSGIYPSQG